MFTWELFTWHFAKSKGQMARAILKVQKSYRCGVRILEKVIGAGFRIYYLGEKLKYTCRLFRVQLAPIAKIIPHLLIWLRIKQIFALID